MKQPSGKRRIRIPKGCSIALIVVVVMLALSYGAFLWARTYLAQQYYKELYEPIWIDGDDAALAGARPVGDSPTAPAPLLLAPDPAPYDTVSYVVCAQMLAAQHGVNVSRAEIEFLAASTYGASSQDGGVSWLPSVDPETGLIPAAQCLGLEREFYVAESSDAYLVELRSILDEGLATRVTVDRSVLLGVDAGTDAQAVVVVGYEGDTFILHDPLGDDAPLTVDVETLLAAERAMSEAMRASWEYNLTTLIVDDKATCDMDAIWRRNGKSLQGGDESGAMSGSAVVERAATVLLNRTTRNSAAALTESLRTMVATRSDMANYLRDTYPDQPDAQLAADALQAAVAIYDRCLTQSADGLYSDEQAREIGLALREAAQLERDAGDALIDQAQD